MIGSILCLIPAHKQIHSDQASVHGYLKQDTMNVDQNHPVRVDQQEKGNEKIHDKPLMIILLKSVARQYFLMRYSL